jgi:hypothetical protein
VSTCARCKEEKPEDGFPWNGRGSRRPICRVCTNVDRTAYKAKNPVQRGKRTLEEIRKDKRDYHRRRTAVKRLLSGKVKGDGPCWCCRNQAVGNTVYRLCIVCLG